MHLHLVLGVLSCSFKVERAMEGQEKKSQVCHLRVENKFRCAFLSSGLSKESQSQLMEIEVFNSRGSRTRKKKP